MMLHGDISNTRQAVVGIRCENTLFAIKKGVMPFSYRLKHSIRNERVYRLMSYLYWETDMTVMLIIDDKHFSDSVEDFLYDLPLGQICNIRSITEVTMMLNTGDLSYFVDNDKIELQNVNNKYAMDFSTFDSMLKRNRKVSRYET